MVQEIKNVVTWLKNWFYDKTEVYAKTETYKKSEVDTALNSKLNSNLTTANKMLVTDGSGDVILENKPDVSGKIDTAGTGLSKSGTTLNHNNSITAQSTAVFKKFTYDGQGHITGTSNVSGTDLPIHNQPSQSINESNTLSNLGFRDRTTQDQINVAIDGIIGQLQSIKAIEVVGTLPTASATTMGKLYIVSENSKVNVYYTKQSGSTYSWQKMDADILDELIINWSDVQHKPFETVDTTITDGSTNPVTNNAIYDALTLKQNQIELVTTLPDINDVSHGYMGIRINTSTSPTAYELFFADKRGSSSSSWHWIYYKDFASIATLINSKVSKGDAVTSISLVPKGSDPTADAYNGVIRLYYGDES